VPLVLAEFVLIYGNDWYVVPLEVNVGSLCRLRSLVVTNSFGDQVSVAPFTPPNAPPGRGDGRKQASSVRIKAGRRETVPRRVAPAE
jgi:hypothetical protein